MKKVDLHTDGSCSGNPGPGGWAAVLVHGGHERELVGKARETTNNRMELTAVIEGLRALKEPCRVTVHSDSRYVIDAFAKGWIDAWQARGWKKKNGEPVLNAELWRELLAGIAGHEVDWRWVEGHAGNLYNERCDSLAVSAGRPTSA